MGLMGGRRAGKATLRWRCARGILRRFLALLFLLCPASPVGAAHPLITDDAGTLGVGGWQLELQSDLLRIDRVAAPGGVPVEQRRKLDIFMTELSCGVAENLDVQFGLGHLKQRTTENSIVMAESNGMGDATLDLKWRFHESGGFSFALKPGLTLPTGDENEGLGTGRVSWGMTLIAAWDIGSWTVLGNLAYSRARFGLPQQATDSRSDLWRVSGGATYALTGQARLVGEVGVRSNESRNDPYPLDGNSQFGMVGLIYSFNKNVDLDVGFRRRLNRAEFDKAFLAGAAFRW
jgi:hypothetical protein